MRESYRKSCGRTTATIKVTSRAARRTDLVVLARLGYNLEGAFHGIGERKMHEKSIELLNRAVADELTAIHQYMYFHFHCDDQAYDLLAGLFRRTAIEEMLHTEQLAERILFLKGEVEMVASAEVTKTHDVREMLAMAAELEQKSVRDYNMWANECAANADSVSKRVFEALVEDEERHYDQFDIEMENVDKFGERYLALQSIERSRSISAGAAAAE
jgi:bacterioferritin